MDLLGAYVDFMEDTEAHERVAFDAALDGMCCEEGQPGLDDVLFQIFKCQKAIAMLIMDMEKVKARLNKKKAP